MEGRDIRILRVVSDLYPNVVGGLGLHAHEISKWQSNNGHKVKVLTVKGATSNGFERNYDVEEFKSIVKPKGNGIAPSLLIGVLKQQNDYDIIHAHSHLFFSTNMTALAKRMGGVPMVMTTHGMVSTNVPGWVQDIYRIAMARWTLDSADVHICYTKEDAQKLMDLGVREDLIRIIHNGVNVELFCPPPRDQGGSNKVIWCGRFVPGKGVDILVEAFHLALQEVPELQLLLVGDGPQKGQIEQQISRLGIHDKVTIITYIPNKEMPDIYRECSMFVLPSHYEGVPRTVLESMSCGLPVVCTDLPQLRPIVKGHGFLIPDSSIREFADAIVTLAKDENLRRSLGASGSELISSNYSWDSAMRETIKVYQALIEEKTSKR